MRDAFNKKVTVTVDKEFVDQLRGLLGCDADDVSLLKEALTLYRWAAEKARNGETIVSCVPSEGKPLDEVILPYLKARQLRSRRQKPHASIVVIR